MCALLDPPLSLFLNETRKLEVWFERNKFSDDDWQKREQLKYVNQKVIMKFVTESWKTDHAAVGSLIGLLSLVTILEPHSRYFIRAKL